LLFAFSQAQLLKLKLRLSDSVWSVVVLNGLKLCLAPVVEFRKQSRLFSALTTILKSRKAVPDERVRFRCSVCEKPPVFQHHLVTSGVATGLDGVFHVSGTNTPGSSELEQLALPGRCCKQRTGDDLSRNE
jgi:hypothetical protein